MKKLSVIDWIALILVLVGALNWGLIGFFKWDLVAAIFGDMSSVTRVIYALVGIAALWVVVLTLPKAMKE
jgi:uncharacterized membrane protein YuzA (DUF378 family)